MEISQAKSADILDVVFFIRQCVNDFNAKGLFHWNNSHPGHVHLTQVINEGNLYLCKDLQRVTGLFKYAEAPGEEFNSLVWNESDKPLIFSFLSIHPDWKRKNNDVVEAMLTYINDKALEEDFSSIRTDVYNLDDYVCERLQNDGFELIGDYAKQPQNLVFKGFEKQF